MQDPKLAEHLSHWGIDMIKMAKTDRSMVELEVELNKKYDFSKVSSERYVWCLKTNGDDKFA